MNLHAYEKTLTEQGKFLSSLAHPRPGRLSKRITINASFPPVCLMPTRLAKIGVGGASALLLQAVTRRAKMPQQQGDQYGKTDSKRPPQKAYGRLLPGSWNGDGPSWCLETKWCGGLLGRMLSQGLPGTSHPGADQWPAPVNAQVQESAGANSRLSAFVDQVDQDE